MVREIWIIVAAITLARPDVAEPDATEWAKVLQREAREHDFDPFTGVAMIAKESGWHPEAISKNGEDYGLGQIRARYVGACKKDQDPVRSPSPGCREVQKRLLEPEHNIETMAEIITRNRELCREKTGSAKFHQWLASYQGRNYPKQKRWCQPGKKTWEVIEYRRWLIDETRNLKPPKAEEPKASDPKAEPPKEGGAQAAGSL